jgi:cold shock CspA family protein
MSESSGINRTKKAKVLIFNENLGNGILQVIGSSEKIRFSYRDLIDAEGFKILFPGDLVEVRFKEGRIEVRKIDESPLRID